MLYSEVLLYLQAAWGFQATLQDFGQCAGLLALPVTFTGTVPLVVWSPSHMTGITTFVTVTVFSTKT